MRRGWTSKVEFGLGWAWLGRVGWVGWGQEEGRRICNFFYSLWSESKRLWIFFQGLVTGCNSFCIFFIFYNIHSFNHIHTIHLYVGNRWGPSPLPHTDLTRFIFPCFGIFANTIYSNHLLHIRLIYSHRLAQKYSIWCKKYMLQWKKISLQIEYSLIIFSHTGEYCFKIFVEKRIFAKLYANFTFKRIFDCKYSQTSEYSLANIPIPANIPSVMLQIV